ncbi:MAG: DUF4256 domain-containing protein [Saprospiraceae bacterium]
MAKQIKKEISKKEQEELFKILEQRFEKNQKRHKNISWSSVKIKLENQIDKLWSLHKMEDSGGEPDVVAYDKKTDEYIFMDCSPESPKNRRSLCYDRDALDTRKEFKPEDNVLDMASSMGIELINEEQYRELQKIGPFDLKTSSWIETPAAIRKLGGALFGDYRYGTVFVYHNGAQSYYAARGFRGMIKV